MANLPGLTVAKPEFQQAPRAERGGAKAAAAN